MHPRQRLILMAFGALVLFDVIGIVWVIKRAHDHAARVQAAHDQALARRRKPLDPEVDAVAILKDGTIMSQAEFLAIVQPVIEKGSDEELLALNKRFAGTQVRNWVVKYEGLGPPKPAPPRRAGNAKNSCQPKPKP